jgi:hypothetical protein
MEELQKEGLTRSIGVSNFREEDLMEMEPHWTIPPAVNQASPTSITPLMADRVPPLRLPCSQHAAPCGIPKEIRYKGPSLGTACSYLAST